MKVIAMVLWLLEKVVERPDAVWLCLAATGFVSSVTVLVLVLR